MRHLMPVLGLICLTLPATAQDRGGQQLFQDHCASCHGIAARGDGPMADVLTLPVPDLTALALGNDGAFPLARVISVIDGRHQLRGHGGPMPVFGPVLGGDSVVLDGPDGTVIETRADIVALAAWLEVIQQ